MSTVIGIAGSLRKESFNAKLLRAAAAFAPQGCELEISSIAEVPLYNADRDEAEGAPPAVAELKDRLAAADGFLLATPEYNASLPGVAKNAIDWLSRPASDIPRVFGGLPTGLIGATPGRGGTRFSQTAWLPVLRYLRVHLFTGDSLFVAGARDVFDDSGTLADEDVREQLGGYMEAFGGFVSATSRKV
jgi:chromate reductase, NAD(P)H dehydrogenase (quinone)